MTPPDLRGFTYLRHLGSGGFADVLLYEQEWPKQRVAVKVVRPDIAMTPREKQLFRSEADAMARLADHPYIVSVLTAGETEAGLPYLVMRYCPPPDLGARVRTQPLSVADALSTGVKLASAVETAHRSGILHRDIKPSNVLVTTYNEPALTDFGIAGRMQEVESETEVRMSYPWAPPELIDGRSRGSVASDVYSLGATIWNLLVGSSPFVLRHGDNTDHALAARILHAPPPPTGRADVPPGLDQLLQQCLAKSPQARPASALEVARSLQRIEAELGLPRTPVSVENARPDDDQARDLNPDATRVKPMGVIHAQGTTGAGPGTATGPALPASHTTGGHRPEGHRGTVAWSVLGVVAALGLALGLFWWGGGDEEADPDPDPSATTPAPVLPTSLDPPEEFSAARRDGRIVFRWAQPDPRPGDTWQWESTYTGDGGRAERPQAALPATAVDAPGAGGRACIQVRLVRDGRSSQPAGHCTG